MHTVARAVKRSSTRITFIVMAALMALGVSAGLLASLGGSAAQASTTSSPSPAAGAVGSTLRAARTSVGVATEAVTLASHSTGSMTHGSSAPSAPSSVTITRGMTEWSVSQSTGVPLPVIMAANSVSPTDLQVGQQLQLAGTVRHVQPVQQASQFPNHPTAKYPYGDGDGDGFDLTHSPFPSAPSVAPQGGVQQQSSAGVQGSTQAPSSPVQQSAPVQQSSGVSSGGQFHIPGLSQSQTNCIAFRESTNGTNPAANGNVFGIIPASGHNVSGMSVAQQEAVAGQIVRETGGTAIAWAADGCPGT